MATQRYVLAAVLAAAFAGCSSGQQITPAGGTVGTRSHASSSGMSSFAVRPAFVAPSGLLQRPVVPNIHGKFVFDPSYVKARAKAGTFSFVFMSDNSSGNVIAYDEASGVQVAQCMACGGWGLTTDRATGDIAMGVVGGSVTLWHVTATAITQYNTLTLAFAADQTNAFGIAFDDAGHIFASEFPRPVVDEFDIRGKGKPKHIFYPPVFESVYFIATSGSTVILDGWDYLYNFIGARLLTSGEHAGDVKLLESYGSYAAGTGFPGGIVVDSKHNLIVNNQRGSLSTYAPPWTGSATSTFDWPTGANDYIGIGLDGSETAIWAADILTVGPSTIATVGQANSYPLGSIGLQTSPQIAFDEFLGATVSPAK